MDTGGPSDGLTVMTGGGVAPPSAAPSSSLLVAGQPFGPYRIVRLLGSGGMGEVYEAEETAGGRRVALKLFNRPLGDATQRERFLREGQLAASISHPHCVYILGTDEIEGLPVLAMELVSGGTLKDLVPSQGPLELQAAVDIVLQVIDGLEAAAASGVLHRDIKPANCFIDQDGTVKVGDFGISTSLLARDETHLTLAGTVLGTPGYAAPEQLRAEPVDVRADIYSVGATLYALLTGGAPFESANLVALVAMVLQDTPPSPREARPGVPRALSAIVMRCLAKKREDRPQDYGELRRLLLPFCSLAPTPAMLGRRFAAGVIDFVLCLFAAAPFSARMVQSGIAATVQGGPQSADAQLWTMLLAADFVTVLYYGILEGVWGASVGKATLGLRVVDRVQQNPAMWCAFARALIWTVSLKALMLVLASVLGPSAIIAAGGRPDVPAWLRFIPTIGGALGFGILFASIRRSNGFAGLHELATGTRVVNRHAVPARPLHARQTITPAVLPTSERVGPYWLIVRETTSDGGELLAAFDDQLRRRVWVRPVAPGQPPLPAARRECSRPGRARWLTGCRSPGEAWDAFEAWEGEPLVASPSPVPWGRVRGWLADVNAELDACLRAGELPPLVLDRVWVADDGRATLLDWPAPGVAAGTVADSPEASAFVRVQRFLYAIARRALNGGDRARDLAVGSLQASVILDGLQRAAFRDSAELSAALQAAEDRPDSVAWRRALHLGLSSVAPVLLLAVGTTGIVSISVAFNGKPDVALLSICLERLQLIELQQRNQGAAATTSKTGGQTTAEAASRGSVTAERRALGIFIAGRLRGAAADPALRNPFVIVRASWLRRAGKVLADNPRVSEEDLRQARTTLQDFLTAARRKAAEAARGRIRWDVLALVASLLIALNAIPSTVCAFLFRGGCLLRGLGLGVATKAGNEASRLRALLRTLIAWSPVLAAATLALAGDSLVAGSVPLTLVSAVVGTLLLLFLAGVVVALVNPSCGLQDRIARTRVVLR